LVSKQLLFQPLQADDAGRLWVGREVTHRPIRRSRGWIGETSRFWFRGRWTANLEPRRAAARPSKQPRHRALDFRYLWGANILTELRICWHSTRRLNGSNGLDLDRYSLQPIDFAIHLKASLNCLNSRFSPSSAT
jgi:hypothetical protein